MAKKQNMYEKMELQRCIAGGGQRRKADQGQLLPAGCIGTLAHAVLPMCVLPIQLMNSDSLSKVSLLCKQFIHVPLVALVTLWLSAYLFPL